jgi:flagellar biogenesis protein FliO
MTTPNLLLLAETPLGGAQGPDLTRYLVVCGGLLLLVGVLGFAFRKLVSRTLAARAAQRQMQVMDMLPLGGKHKLCVVRCYDRTFLIGVGEKELSNIAELDPVIAPARETPPGKVELHSFSKVLERLRGTPATQPETVPTAPKGVLSREGLLG